jgi:hypothetical protein
MSMSVSYEGLLIMVVVVGSFRRCDALMYHQHFAYLRVINEIHQAPFACTTTARITTRPNTFTFPLLSVLTKAC